MTRRTLWGALSLIALGVAASCSDVTDINVVQVSGTGLLFGQAVLDANGNGVIDVLDQPLSMASVVLSSAGAADTVGEATTDASGVYVLMDVPVGAYSVSLGAAVLGDSLMPLGTIDTLSIQAGDTTQYNLGAAYPELALADVRVAAPGQRVFTKGIALNPRQSFGDGVVHLQEGSVFLRATNVAPSGLATGDSVRFLGRVGVDNGQPILDTVTPFVLRSAAAFPLAQAVTLAAADSADGGPLDAALVRISGAEITDTATVNGDLQFWAHNGTDSLQIVFRVYLSISPNPPIRPDTTVRISQMTGLLRPYDDGSGSVRWRLLPRGPGDVSTELKLADVAVTTAFAPAAATTGDTVEIVVTARNAGTTHAATGVAVSDTIPAALTFLSMTATRGSYDSGTSRWNVGTLQPGATDTLRISVRVDGSGPQNVFNTATSLGLQLQVETNPGNDSQTAQLTIS